METRYTKPDGAPGGSLSSGIGAQLHSTRHSPVWCTDAPSPSCFCAASRRSARNPSSTLPPLQQPTSRADSAWLLLLQWLCRTCAQSSGEPVSAARTARRGPRGAAPRPPARQATSTMAGAGGRVSAAAWTWSEGGAPARRRDIAERSALASLRTRRDPTSSGSRARGERHSCCLTMRWGVASGSAGRSGTGSGLVTPSLRGEGRQQPGEANAMRYCGCAAMLPRFSLLQLYTEKQLETSMPMRLQLCMALHPCCILCIL